MSERSTVLLSKSRVCREAAERATEPIVRDAFEDAAQWFLGRVPTEDLPEESRIFTDEMIERATTPAPEEGFELEKGWLEGRKVHMSFGEGVLYGAAVMLILLAGLAMGFEEGGDAAAVFGVSILCGMLLAYKLGLMTR